MTLLFIARVYPDAPDLIWNMGSFNLEMSFPQEDPMISMDGSLLDFMMYNHYGHFAVTVSGAKIRHISGSPYYTVLPVELSYSFFSNRLISPFHPAKKLFRLLEDVNFFRPLQVFAMLGTDVYPQVLPYFKIGARAQWQTFMPYAYTPNAGLEVSFDSNLKFSITLFADLGLVLYFFLKGEKDHLEEVPNGYVY